MSADSKQWLRLQLQKSRRENQIAQQQDNTPHKDSGIGTDSEESATNLSYENENLKIEVKQADHKQERRFRIQDHLFHLLVIPKKDKMPKLIDILTFLHAAFLFIMTKIKKFYAPADRNIVFMTLYQSDIVNGLNTGISKLMPRQLIFLFT